MKRKITIIEDDSDLRNLMRMPLQAAGYEVVALTDGDSLNGNPNDASDLYLIDLNLGGGSASGLDVCKKIKSQWHSGTAPVIIIISANPDFRHLAMAACADDTLTKPFTARALLEKIAEYFLTTSGYLVLRAFQNYWHLSLLPFF
jgi:DNA-binding response OmpR family regulator